MRFALILAVWCIALLALASMNDRATNNGLPLVASALPSDPGAADPWSLNTRCTITNQNLPVRDPERTA